MRAGAKRQMRSGRPHPLGVHCDGEGANVAVFSDNATSIELCLFSEDGRRETERLALPERSGPVRHGYTCRGLRPARSTDCAPHGPYAPEHGHRFNPNKLLLDPYAHALRGRFAAADACLGYDPASPEARSVVFERGQRTRDAEMHSNGHPPRRCLPASAPTPPGRRP